MDIRASVELSANGVTASVAVVGAAARARTDRVVVAVSFRRSRAWLDSTAEHILTSGTGSRYQASSITLTNHVRGGAAAAHLSTRGHTVGSVAAIARAHTATIGARRVTRRIRFRGCWTAMTSEYLSNTKLSFSNYAEKS